MPESEEKPKREPREEITRHAMIICDQRPPGAHKEAQKKMDFYEQVIGSDKKNKYRTWQKVNLALLLCHVVRPEKALLLPVGPPVFGFSNCAFASRFKGLISQAKSLCKVGSAGNMRWLAAFAVLPLCHAFVAPRGAQVKPSSPSIVEVQRLNDEPPQARWGIAGVASAVAVTSGLLTNLRRRVSLEAVKKKMSSKSSRQQVISLFVLYCRNILS
eukprot:symbB.v1.2.039157.t1/scaffold6377.1/size18626/2